MKLIDFKIDSDFNDLKSLMGIPRDVYGDYDPQIKISCGISFEDLEKLESGTGLDVNLEQLTILSDRTLAFKDRRVLLYIRDKHIYDDRPLEETLPKYHLIFCSTLSRMKDHGRFHRYKVASEMTGEFEINLIYNNIPKNQKKMPLKVCKCCLKELPFDGFVNLKRSFQKSFVEQFKPSHFFEKYPKNHNFYNLPKSSEMTSPVDVYPPDWRAISDRVRSSVDWCCVKCKRNFSGDKKEFLQVHHVNGNKADNSAENLVSLCVECHSNEFMHEHVSKSAAYKKFKASFKEFEPF